MKLSLIFAPVILALTTAATSAGVMQEGNTLTITGMIDQYTFMHWSQKFTKEITHVKLASPGGYVKYGDMIANDILANKDRVSTEAIGTCASMCAVMWMAAEDHVYNEKGKVGFHLSYLNNKALQDMMFKDGMNSIQEQAKSNLLNDVKLYLKYLNNKELIGEFLDGLAEFGLMPTDMWYPSKLELTALEGNWITLKEVKEADVLTPATVPATDLDPATIPATTLEDAGV